jgi:hypothetical protein
MPQLLPTQCLTSVYEAWSGLWARTICLPFDTQWITTVNIVFGNSRRLLLASLLARSPQSVAGLLLPRLPCLHASQISQAHFFRNISTLCQQIHSALSKLTNGSQVSNVAKKSGAAVSQYSDPSRTCFNRFCPRIKDQCFFSRNPATHTFFHSLNALSLCR